MANKTANIDYLCIIRDNNGKVTFETIDIPASTELLSRLEDLCEDDNASVLDMQVQMARAFNEKNRNPINYVAPYSYMDSFIDYSDYPSALSSSEYDKKIFDKRDLLGKQYAYNHKALQDKNASMYHEGKMEYITREISQFQNDIKRHYLRKAIRYIAASNYIAALHKVKEQKDIRMVSTDTLGWSVFPYKVTKDITITIRTNFGYGESSYFNLGMRYKDIDILPYSYMVRYYYANHCDLIRYTRVYAPARDSWDFAFSFAKEAACMASDSPEEFTRHWILDEIKEMIHLLQELLHKPQNYIRVVLNNSGKNADCHYFTVRNMNNTEKERYGVYPEEMMMAIRAEKITGALDYLDNLTKLSKSFPVISTYIKDIKDMAVSIVPDIDKMVDRINTRISRQEDKKSILEVKLSTIEKEVEPHVNAINEMYVNRGENNICRFLNYYEAIYAESHSEYAVMKRKKEEINGSIRKIAEEISLRSSFRDSLMACRRRVSEASLIEGYAA